MNQIKKKIQNKTATYHEANQFSIEVGEALAKVFQEHLSEDQLPNGRMYYNIAKKVVDPMMHQNYDLIAENTSDIQNLLNRQANLSLKAIKHPINQDKIDGIVQRLADSEKFDDIKWILKEPIVNFSQSIVDDSIQANADFQYDSGLKPKIIRRANSGCCDWCSEVAGTYDYSKNIPRDVFRRHRNCRCSVEYLPGDGRRQNVHTKKYKEENESLIEYRIKQNDDIIYSRKKKDSKEIGRIQRIIKSNVLGEEINGVKIKDVSEHFAERSVERGLKASDILDALNRPLEIGDIKYDSQDRPSFKVIGEKATFYINPDTGNLTTSHKTSSYRIKKLKGGSNNEANA
ncbi:hypothetical protein [Facklamia hominis]|uniref:hypothetical protein n=1 Tax=Facklamia hominis TaxID=178214 RepID=UPI000C7D07E0|nr:hypothetical protein [Facklamia hominis]PKY92993.1 hypothetical protein CYJ56_04955 [Facklamia hominis]